VPQIYLRMDKTSKKSQPDWPRIVRRLNDELSALSPADRGWLEERVAAIEALQLSLDKLFREAGGLKACADCDGECCGCGRHHLTLTNLLSYLLTGENPPAPDFECTCPFLGDMGCLLPVARRPYNCITFFCETLEDRLDSAGREKMKVLDHELRREYQRVEQRYPAASLRGIWIALERIGDGLLLQRATGQVVK